MMNEAKILTNLVCDVEKARLGNKMFTHALLAIEESDWEGCLNICQNIMEVSTNIEQRIATQLLQGLANGRSVDVVNAYLDEAYRV